MNRLRRVKDSIERRKDFNEARRILDNSPSSSLGSNVFSTEKTIRDEKEDLTLISRDRGNGRASLGIRFLELASISFLGKNLDSMVKFDTIPVFVNLRFFYSDDLNDVEKVDIIARSLGVDEFLEILRINNSSLLPEINDRFMETFNTVIEGNFRVSNSRRLLALCRVLVTRTIEIQNRNRVES